MRRTTSLVLAAACLVALVALFRFARRYDPLDVSNRPPSLGELSIRLDQAMVISRTAGVPEWRFVVDRIEMQRSPSGDLAEYHQADFTGLRSGIFYRNGKPEATFTAGRASYDRLGGRFDIRGGLHLRSVKGDRVDAEACLWSERDDVVRLTRGASGVFRGQRLTAPLMLFSPKRRFVQCPQGADAVLNGDPLRASRVVWNLDGETVWCPGMVSGRRKNVEFQAYDFHMNLRTHRWAANKGRATIRIQDENEEPEGLRW